MKRGIYEAHITRINPCIPTTLWYRYTASCNVPKFNTIPIPAVSVLETLQAFLYPWPTLVSMGSFS